MFFRLIPTDGRCRRSALSLPEFPILRRGRIICGLQPICRLRTTNPLSGKKKDILNVLESQQLRNALYRAREEITETDQARWKLSKKMSMVRNLMWTVPAKECPRSGEFLILQSWRPCKDPAGPPCRSGRTRTFLDIYNEKDIKAGFWPKKKPRYDRPSKYTNTGSCRFLRTPVYNDLLFGRPVWLNLIIGWTDRWRT